MHPSELVKDTKNTDQSMGMLKKLYDKTMIPNCELFNSIYFNILAAPAYGEYIAQFIQRFRASILS